MSSTLAKLGALALVVTCAVADGGYGQCPFPDPNGCASYGVDFQNGLSYFQNTNSNDAFSFVSQFEGCDNDVVQNLLVDTNNYQNICTNTTLTPDDSNQLSVCPVQKSQLASGNYALLIISNNGRCAPIAYERDIYITAGPQATTTLPPSTLIMTATSTPVYNTTSTTTTTETTTFQYTKTLPASRFTPTVTITKRSYTSTTVGWRTRTITSTTYSVTSTTVLVTPTCITPRRQWTRDPKATKTATVVTAAAQTPAAVNARDAQPEPEPESAWVAVPADPVERLQARRLRHAALKKRSPDDATLTVTPTEVVTSTSTVTAPTATATIVVISTVTRTTYNPSIATTYSGITAQQTTTTTTTTFTQTVTVDTTWSKTTTTVTRTATITKKTTPPAVASACKSAGGKLSSENTNWGSDSPPGSVNPWGNPWGGWWDRGDGAK